MDNPDSDEKILEEEIAKEMAEEEYDPNDEQNILNTDLYFSKKKNQKSKTAKIDEKTQKRKKKFIEGVNAEGNEPMIEPNVSQNQSEQQKDEELGFAEQTQSEESVEIQQQIAIPKKIHKKIVIEQTQPIPVPNASPEDPIPPLEPPQPQEPPEELGFAQLGAPKVQLQVVVPQWEVLIQQQPIGPQEPGFAPPLNPLQQQIFPIDGQVQQPIGAQQPPFPQVVEWPQQIFPPIQAPVDAQELQPMGAKQPEFPQLFGQMNGIQVLPENPQFLPINQILPDMLEFDVDDNDEEVANAAVPVVIAEEDQEAMDFNAIQRQRMEEMQRRIDEDEEDEKEDEDERFKNNAKRDVYVDPNEVITILERGLRNHKENAQLIKVNQIIRKERPSYSPEGAIQDELFSRTTSPNIESLNLDELNLLFAKFTFQGQVVLSRVCSHWRTILNSIFAKQTYLWLSHEDKTSQRFLPIEDCCEDCHFAMDSEPCIRVISESLSRVINVVLSLTPNLKCLRLYRFVLNKSRIAKRLVEMCPKLTHLDLTECKQLSLPVMKILIKKYPNLEHLILNSTAIGEDFLKPINAKSMKNLKTLSVNCTYITGEFLKSLSHSIKRLDLRYCPDFDFKNLVKFLKMKKFIELQHLKIDGTDRIEVMENIGATFKNLILLEVNESLRQVKIPQSLLSSVALLRSLQSLKIGKSIAITSNIMLDILRGCSVLRSFSIEFRESDVFNLMLKENDLSLIPQNWPLLERLEMKCCSVVGQQFLESLQQLANLYYLNLSECTKLDDEVMGRYILTLPKLSYVVLDRCNLLSKKTLDAVILKARRMTNEVLHVSLVRCNLTNLPYLKAKLLPNNLRLTFSSIYSQRYCTFDGTKTKFGKIEHIFDFLNGR